MSDLANKHQVSEALKDVNAVFYIAPAFLPNEAAVGKGVVEAAREGGRPQVRCVDQKLTTSSLSRWLLQAIPSPLALG